MDRKRWWRTAIGQQRKLSAFILTFLDWVGNEGCWGRWHVWARAVGKCEGKGRLGRPRCRWVIILKWIVKKLNGRPLTGLICLRIGTDGRLLWRRWWTFSFRKMWGLCWLSEDLLASEGLCLMELAGWCFERPSSALQWRTSWTDFMDCVGTYECACAVDHVLFPIIRCQLWCVLCAWFRVILKYKNVTSCSYSLFIARSLNK